MLPLEADVKRMQNFNHLLHRGFPQQGLGPGLARRRHERGPARAPEAHFWGRAGQPGLLGSPVQRLGPVQGREDWRWGARGPHGAAHARPLGTGTSPRMSLSRGLAGLSFGAVCGDLVSGWGPQLSLRGSGSRCRGALGRAGVLRLSREGVRCLKNNAGSLLASGGGFTHGTFRAGLKECVLGGGASGQWRRGRCLPKAQEGLDASWVRTGGGAGAGRACPARPGAQGL